MREQPESGAKLSENKETERRLWGIFLTFPRILDSYTKCRNYNIHEGFQLDQYIIRVGYMCTRKCLILSGEMWNCDGVLFKIASGELLCRQICHAGWQKLAAKNLFFKTNLFRAVNIRLDWKVFWESENWSKLLESAFWNVFCRNPFKSAVLYLLCCTHCTTQCGPHCITLLRHTECCLLTEATHAYIAILVPWKRIKLIPCSLTSLACFRRRPKMIANCWRTE